jgi:hypothetical protein
MTRSATPEESLTDRGRRSQGEEEQPAGGTQLIAGSPRTRPAYLVAQPGGEPPPAPTDADFAWWRRGSQRDRGRNARLGGSTPAHGPRSLQPGGRRKRAAPSRAMLARRARRPPARPRALRADAPRPASGRAWQRHRGCGERPERHERRIRVAGVLVEQQRCGTPDQRWYARAPCRCHLFEAVLGPRRRRASHDRGPGDRASTRPGAAIATRDGRAEDGAGHADCGHLPSREPLAPGASQPACDVRR